MCRFGDAFVGATAHPHEFENRACRRYTRTQTDNKHIHITYILILVHMHIHIQTKHRKIAVSYLTKPKTSNLAPNPLCLVSMASAVSLSEFYGLAKTVQTLPAQ